MTRLATLSQGLTGTLDPTGGFLLSPEHWVEESSSLGQFLQKYGLSLLAVHDSGRRWGLEGHYAFFRTLPDSGIQDFTRDRETLFNPVIGSLMDRRAFRELEHAKVLMHRVHAARYHLARLCGLYRAAAMTIMRGARQMPVPPNVKANVVRKRRDAEFLLKAPGEHVVVVMGPQEQISYEIDAFLVSVRTALDCLLPVLRPLLPKGRRVRWPSSFKDLVGALEKLPLPEGVAATLRDAWSAWGGELRDLRDLPVHRGHSLVGEFVGPVGTSIRSECGLLALRVCLPDNPADIKARGHCATYGLERDLLEYAHARYLDLVELSLCVLHEGFGLNPPPREPAQDTGVV